METEEKIRLNSFIEIQRFNQWWIVALLIGVWVVTTGMALYQWITGIPVGDHPMSDQQLVVPVILVTIVFAFLLSSRLKTKIDFQGIHVSFYPFIWKERTFLWEELASVSVREYRPIAEYGGWGLRGFGKNRAWNVRGNQGIQLVFKSGKKLLIGTQKPKEAAAIMAQLFQTMPE
jgi:hypothetical protein